MSSFARTLVKKRVEDQMLSTINILRGNLGGLDQATGQVGGIGGASTIYTGKARIWTVNGSGVLALGEGEFDTRQTNISIPIDARPLPRRDDLVQVVADDDADSDLDNRYFRVLDVDGGGYIGAARRLTCVSWFSSRYWEGKQ